MSGNLFVKPSIVPVDSSGQPLANATYTLYISGTTTLAAIYADANLSATLTNPVTADSGGVFTPIWLDPSITYRSVLQDESGALIEDTDPYPAIPGFPLYPAITTAETAALVTPTDFNYAESDIRRYGADVTATDNSLAINNALLVSANGGQAAFIPPGTWQYTSTLTATLTCSMYGTGQLSVLAPTSCDGLTFTDQGTSLGSRKFCDFAITGTVVAAYHGIAAQMLSTSGNRIEGVLFRNITISGGFGYAVFGYGYYRATFDTCHLFNNLNGFRFQEQSIKVSLLNCMVIKSPIALAGDGSTALSCQVVSGVRPQDITATGCFFYGHDIGVSFGNILYSGLFNCDIDQCATTGVALTTVNGGCRVRDCWINTNSGLGATATTGILVNSLGAANYDSVLIEGNYILCTVANVASVGISLGLNQFAVVTNANTVGSSSAPFATAIVNNVANFHICKYNTLYASSLAISVHSSSNGVEIGPNITQNGTPLSFTAGTPANFFFYGTGSYTVTIDGMNGGGSITDTWIWASTGLEISHTPPSSGSLGTSAATTMTAVGMPVYIRPSATRSVMCRVRDNTTNAMAVVSISTAGVMTFFKDLNGTALTGSGNKGVADQIRYMR